MTPAQFIGLATVAVALAGVQWITRNHEQQHTPPAWTFHRAPFTGTPCAVCQTCGETWVYWEADDLDAHTEQHQQGEPAQ